MRTRTASVTATVVALMLTGGLAACSGQASALDCVSSLSSGALSDSVKISGEFGSEPSVEIPTNMTASTPQVTLVETATNRDQQADQDSVLTLDYAIFDSSTGETLQSTEDFTDDRGGDFIPVLVGENQGSIAAALECTAPGDRVTVVLSKEESVGFTGNEDALLVAVIDVHDVSPFHAEGPVSVLPTGFPGVVTDETGRPGVVIAPGAAPTTERTAVRVTGSGNEVTAEDSVVAQVLSVDWAGELRSTTWEQGPEGFGTEENPASDIRSALTGYTVGSQIVVLVPAEDQTATIYVVDILAAA